MTVLRFRGVRIDWPVYQHVIDRARLEEWLVSQVRVASPESLILTKLIAFRDQDQIDIASLLAANRDQLDLEYIRQEWSTIAEPDDSSMARFEQMLVTYYRVT
jgi:hypothetical protein